MFYKIGPCRSFLAADWADALVVHFGDVGVDEEVDGAGDHGDVTSGPD